MLSAPNNAGQRLMAACCVVLNGRHEQANQAKAISFPIYSGVYLLFRCACTGGSESSPGENGTSGNTNGDLFGEYAHVLDAKDLQVLEALSSDAPCCLVQVHDCPCVTMCLVSHSYCLPSGCSPLPTIPC